MQPILDRSATQTEDAVIAANQTAHLPGRSSTFRLEIVALGFILCLAFIIRVYNLNSFPDTLLADEADNAQDAIRILYGQPPENGFFGLDWTSQPAFSAYKEAAFVTIFGFNILVLRLSSAILSTLALLPFYLVLRRQLSFTAALLAAILLATNVWYLNFSRTGWNCIDACLYMLMAMFFLMKGLDTITRADITRWSKWIQFALAGCFCALGLYGYPAGRTTTIAIVAFFPIACFFYRKQFKILFTGYVGLFMLEAILFAPQGIYIVKQWEHFNGRTKVVSIFNHKDYQTDPVNTMLQQFERNIRGPWDGSVNNTAQYSPVGEPQLDKTTGVLVLIGMALTLLSGTLRKRPETWLWWAMLLTGWIFTQVFTVDTPNGARGIGYMPTLIYFAGVGMDTIISGVQYLLMQISDLPLLKPLSNSVFFWLILFVGYGNVNHYIAWQNTPHTRQDRYLYITAREFPIWSAEIVNRAQNKQGSMNVGQWREMHPIQDIANP